MWGKIRRELPWVCKFSSGLIFFYLVSDAANWKSNISCLNHVSIYKVLLLTHTWNKYCMFSNVSCENCRKHTKNVSLWREKGSMVVVPGENMLWVGQKSTLDGGCCWFNAYKSRVFMMNHMTDSWIWLECLITLLMKLKIYNLPASRSTYVKINIILICPWFHIDLSF